MNLLLVVISSVLFWVSVRRVLSAQSRTLADYAILVIWVFNCLPILLDLTVGPPQYHLYPWLVRLATAVESDAVGGAYAAYNLLVLLVLSSYARRAQQRAHLATRVYADGRFLRNPSLVIVAAMPFVLVLASGSLEAFADYTSLGRRISGPMYEVIGASVLIALYAYVCWYFSRSRGAWGKVAALAYFAGIAWIDGKRYIIAVMALMTLYMYMNSAHAKPFRISRRIAAVMVLGLFGLFYVLYALEFKSVSAGLDSLYLALRIDFGRDDVIKYVLYQELIEKAPIIPYRGATVVSALLLFVPRAIWPVKPYPHYRYLTASMLGTGVLSIPAGMTPSLFEMSLANLGVPMGVILTCVVLVWLCWLGDRSRTVVRSALYLILIVTLLTQSLDAITGLLAVFYIEGVLHMMSAAVRGSR